MFFLTRHRIPELRRPIAAKLCTVISICVNYLMQVQKLGGSSPKKFYPRKIFGRIYTTYDFHREYLRKETRYPKSERHTTSSHSSRVQPNKSGELWSSIHRVVHVSLDPPKSNFSGDYISAPRRRWPLKFLHALDTGQYLLAHTTNRVGVPPKILRANI